MCFVALLACSEAKALAVREAVGVYRGWAAFRDEPGPRCYALAAPAVARGGASVAVGFRPGARTGRIAVRFARAARPGSAILLTVDGRPFQLRGRGAEAWAPGPAADRALVAAMRTGVDMAVATRDERGVPMEDRYRLSGAASAIDAAALACRLR